VWRGGHVLFETTEAGTITRSYTWGIGADDLVAITNHQDGNKRYYVVQDLLRSVRGLVERTGSTGTWRVAWRYTPYGELLTTDGSVSFTVRFRWAGAMFDEETGLYFLRTRSYDPRLGRFIQEDVAGFAGGGNLCAYAGDPTSGRDPSGMMSMPEPQYHSDYDLSSYGGWMDMLGGRASGGSWHPGEGFEGSMIGLWDLWTQSERGAAYADYLSAFRRTMAQLDAGTRSGIDSISEGGFALIVSSVGRGNSEFLPQRWGIVNAILASGQIGIDRLGVHTSWTTGPVMGHKGDPGRTVGLRALDGSTIVFTFLNRAVEQLGMSDYDRRHTVVHEALHWLIGLYGYAQSSDDLLLHNNLYAISRRWSR